MDFHELKSIAGLTSDKHTETRQCQDGHGWGVGGGGLAGDKTPNSVITGFINADAVLRARHKGCIVVSLGSTWRERETERELVGRSGGL